MFFKVFFELGHEEEVRVEPIFLPVLADAAEGSSFWKTIVSHYRQTRRWAWGVSDVPYVVRRAFEQRAVPFWARLRRVAFYAEEHVCWPTHWFLLTIGANLVAYFAPATALAPATVLLTTVSAWMLMLCLPCLAVVVYLDRQLRPERHVPLSRWGQAVNLLVWLFIPVIGLILTTLPALDAHTRLLFGKYLHYQVTEKLPADRGYVAPSWTDGASSAGAA
jgi:amino acid transporter